MYQNFLHIFDRFTYLIDKNIWPFFFCGSNFLYLALCIRLCISVFVYLASCIQFWILDPGCLILLLSATILFSIRLFQPSPTVLCFWLCVSDFVSPTSCIRLCVSNCLIRYISNSFIYPTISKFSNRFWGFWLSKSWVFQPSWGFRLTDLWSFQPYSFYYLQVVFFLHRIQLCLRPNHLMDEIFVNTIATTLLSTPSSCLNVLDSMYKKVLLK